jgi:hypothetical protein
MKKLLNILFVTTQGAYLSKEGETVVVNPTSAKFSQKSLFKKNSDA